MLFAAKNHLKFIFLQHIKYFFYQIIWNSYDSKGNECSEFNFNCLKRFVEILNYAKGKHNYDDERQLRREIRHLLRTFPSLLICSTNKNKVTKIQKNSL